MSEPIYTPGSVPDASPQRPPSPSGPVRTLADTLAALGNEGPDSRTNVGAVLRYGTVTAVGTSAPYVGYVQTTATGDAWLTSDGQYIPQVGDLVYLLTQGPVGHVIGRLGIQQRTPAPDVQVFTANGTWTKPTAYPPKYFHITVVAGASGSGSGGRGPAGTIRTGGGSGGSGGRAELWIPAARLTAATYAILVGAAGLPGAPVTTDNTPGNPGTTGGASAFGGNLVYARYGDPGGGGQITNTAGTGGGAGIGMTNGNPGAPSSSGGGNGLNSAIVTNGPGPGGSGAGLDANNTPRTGGTGLQSRMHGLGGVAGAASGSATNNNPTGVPTQVLVSMGSGGPGGSSQASGPGMDGANANGYGASGGGGAASANGFVSGGGGLSTPGIVVVETYF